MTWAGDRVEWRQVTRSIFFAAALVAVKPGHGASPSILWSMTLDGSDPSSADAFSAAAISPSGDVFACGDITNTVPASIVVKLSQSGALIWSRTRTDLGAHALGVAADSSGAGYVVGSYRDAGNLHVLYLDKWGSDGVLLWSRTYQSEPGRRTVGIDVEVSGTELFVAGIAYEAGGGLNPAVLLKFDLSGNLLTATTFMSNGTFDPDATNPDFRSVQVAVDGAGEVFWAYREDSYPAAVVRKTGRDLSLKWTFTVSGDRDLMGLGAAPSGVVVLSGKCIVCPAICCGPCLDLSTYESRWHRISGNRELLWSVSHQEPGVSHTLTFAVTADPSDGFIVAGHAGWTIDNSWIWYAKVNGDGTVAWSRSLPGWGWNTYPNFCVHREQAAGVVRGPGGRLYLCGMVDQATLDGFVTAVDLYPTTASPPEPALSPADLEVGVRLSGNVFSPGVDPPVDIFIVPRTPDPLRVRVFTAAGRPVRDLGAPVLAGGKQWKLTWAGTQENGTAVSRGVYLIRVDGGGLRETLKLVVRPRTP